MARRNLTVQLDEETIRKARIIAASRGRSVSRLISETLEEMVRFDEAYKSARDTALRLLATPFRLGGRIEATRGEWHDR